jgi:hypothetical protein
MPDPLNDCSASPITIPVKLSPQQWAFGFWAIVVTLLGSVLMSYHQPFRAPSDGGVMRLARKQSPGTWHALHFLSSGCACSQRVMRHLLERRPLGRVVEEVLLIDGPGPALPGTDQSIAQLQQEGFTVTRLKPSDIPASTGLRGVPLLSIASPQNEIVYTGGYGPREDQDVSILLQLQSGRTAKPLAIIGCAVGSRVREQSDPFHLKY